VRGEGTLLLVISLAVQAVVVFAEEVESESRSAPAEVGLVSG
jgi:hypothetical protein